MDRFEEGLPDKQQAKVLGYCRECGGELYSRSEEEAGLCDGCYDESHCYFCKHLYEDCDCCYGENCDCEECNPNYNEESEEE